MTRRVIISCVALGTSDSAPGSVTIFSGLDSGDTTIQVANTDLYAFSGFKPISQIVSEGGFKMVVPIRGHYEQSIGTDPVDDGLGDGHPPRFIAILVASSDANLSLKFTIEIDMHGTLVNSMKDDLKQNLIVPTMSEDSVDHVMQKHIASHISNTINGLDVSHQVNKKSVSSGNILNDITRGISYGTQFAKQNPKLVQ